MPPATCPTWGCEGFTPLSTMATRTPRPESVTTRASPRGTQRTRRLDLTKSTLRNRRRPQVAQAFRPANGRRGSRDWALLDTGFKDEYIDGMPNTAAAEQSPKTFADFD